MTGLVSLAEPDLLFGFLAMLFGTFASVALGFIAAKRLSRRYQQLACIVSLMAAVAWWVIVRNHPLLVKLIPFTNLIITGNWICLFVGFIAGIALFSSEGTLLRRSTAPAVLVVVGVFALVYPLWGEIPVGQNLLTEQIICRQTTPFSCSPACAATLLKQEKIEATEQEMVQLCLCRKGTTWQGLYRGLSIKTKASRYRVELFRCKFDRLEELTPGWIILSVGLPRYGEFPSIYEEEYGWKRGDLHSVILRKFVNSDRVLMVDPDVGEEEWSVEDLQLLYRGFGMQLVERSSE